MATNIATKPRSFPKFKSSPMFQLLTIEASVAVFNALTEATLFYGVTTGTAFEFTFFAEELNAPNPVVV